MKQLKWIFSFVVVALLAGCITGTGGESAELDQLATEAAAMDKTGLQAMVTKYTGLISEKVDVVGVLKSKLKAIPYAEMMGEKATAIKQELGETTSLIAKLKDKLAVYTSALKLLK